MKLVTAIGVLGGGTILLALFAAVGYCLYSYVEEFLDKNY